jgi:hypothetical protein
MVMEEKEGDFFKGGLVGKVADIEASVDEISFLSVHIRDPGVGHFHPPEAYIFYVDEWLLHLSSPPFTGHSYLITSILEMDSSLCQ